MGRHSQREYVKIKDVIFDMSTTSIDWVTWMNAYQMGIRKPSYPVPAHSYITLIAPHSVEMVTGIVKTYYENDRSEPYIAYDCDCVFFVTNYPD